MKISSAVFAFLLSAPLVEAQTVLTFITAVSDYSTLKTAVDAAPAGITDYLNADDGSFTFFAPDNDAFATLPSETIDQLLSTPYQPHLACVLSGHIYPDAAITSATITEPLSVESLTAGYMLNLNNSADGFTVNDLPVSAPDTLTSNGIFNTISTGVLLPDCMTKTAVDYLAANVNYSTLVGLVGSANLTTTLSTVTPDGYTVLAPSNDAFGKVDPDLLAYLASNVTALTEVLTYHVLPTIELMTGVTEGDFATLNGANVSVADIMIDTADILVSNGVITTISSVLIPPTMYIPNLKSVLDIVAASPDHTTLEAAVLAAPEGIATFLDGDAPFTLFAPDDDAFATLANETLALLLTAPYQPHLGCLLTGHVYAGGVVSSTDITGPLSVESLTSGYMLDLDRVHMMVAVNEIVAMVTVNDINVTGADIAASNGIIHSLSAGVLLPDCVTQNVVDFAVGNGFSTLVDLVTTADLVGTLSTVTPDGYTVLAPTNDAFSAVDSDLLDYLGSNVTALTEVLTYHVIGKIELMTGVTEGEFTTLNGATVSVTDIQVDSADNLVSNGVVTSISALLIPPTLYIPADDVASGDDSDSGDGSGDNLGSGDGDNLGSGDGDNLGSGDGPDPEGESTSSISSIESGSKFAALIGIVFALMA